MRRTKPWTDDQLLDALRAAAVNGAAPKMSEWTTTVDRPSAQCIVKRFGSWQAACRRVGLETAQEAARRRRLEADLEQARRNDEEKRKRAAEREKREAEYAENRKRQATGKESATAKRTRERAEARRERAQQEIADGLVTVRHATPEEMAEWAAQREARARRFTPEVSELVLPGVTPKKPAELDEDEDAFYVEDAEEVAA